MTATPVSDASEPENHPRKAENKDSAPGMTKEQTALMNKADPALSDARLLPENDRVEAAIIACTMRRLTPPGPPC